MTWNIVQWDFFFHLYMTSDRLVKNTPKRFYTFLLIIIKDFFIETANLIISSIFWRLVSFWGLHKLILSLNFYIHTHITSNNQDRTDISSSVSKYSISPYYYFQKTLYV